MQFKLGSMQISWDLQHSLIMVGSTVGGAVLGYLESQPTTSLIAALGSWSTAKPLLFGALSVAIAALISLAKQTFVVPAAPTQGSHGGPQLPKPMTPQPKDSVPPTTMRREIDFRRRAMRLFAPMGIAGALATCVTGCASFQKWWATVQADPSAAVAQLIRTVQNVITTADTVWAVVSPLLGDKAADASKVYADAKVTLVDALTALENAVNADVEAQKDNPDWSALENDVKAAVSNLIAIVQQYAGGSTALGGSLSGNAPLKHGLATLAANGAAVASWRSK